MRIQKLLAAAGFASRRACEALLREGRVTLNGAPARLGDRADPARDDLRLDGERLRLEKPEYWLVHKPVGVLSTVRDPEGRPTVIELVPRRSGRLFPVGRLDRDTSGLVILTNDGDLTQALLHPSHEVEREYVVTVKGRLERDAQRRLAKGVRLEEGWTAPARVGRVRHDPVSDRSELHLTLREGRKRQIRRALRALGHPVTRLQRIRMGPIRLGDLAPGRARRLTEQERTALRTLAAGAKRVARRPRDAQPARKRRGKSLSGRGKPRGSKTPSPSRVSS